MRILHVASEYPPARIHGLGRYVHDLCVALAWLGHEVHVLTNSLSGRDQDAVMAGVHVHRIHWPLPPEPPDGAAQVMIFQIAAIERFLELATELGRFDVVVSHDWLTVLAAETIRARLGCRWVHTMHDTVHGKMAGQLTDEDRFVAQLEARGCNAADAVVAVSRHVADELERLYRTPADRIQVVPAAVSEAWFRGVEAEVLPDLRTALASPDRRIVSYVGRLDREKGVDCLIEAFAQVSGTHPEATLVVAGVGGQEEKLRGQAASLKLGDHVRFLGYVSGGALEAVLKLSDLLVCPSTYEPFGIVPLEGMINGVPVIVSRVGGMAEIVEDGKSGLHVPPGDPAALATAMRGLLDRPDEARRLAEAGRERARTVYNWNRVAGLLEPVYAGEPAPGPAPAAPKLRPKLVAGIVVKNGEPFAEACLRDLSEYVDEIVIVNDGSTDRTVEICSQFPKVVQIAHVNKSWYHEGIVRNHLLFLVKARKPDWILLPDIDEIFEERFKREIDFLMEREDVGLYAFPFYHFWRGTTHYRVDGKWGRETENFPIPRLVRNHPDLRYPVHQALGCAQIVGAVGKAVVSNLRVKHYGHMHREISEKKFELYSKLDPDHPYDHMISEEGLETKAWRE